MFEYLASQDRIGVVEQGEVDFADAQAGDRLGFFLFGKEPQPATPVPVNEQVRG